jgi:hypothetical protein
MTASVSPRAAAPTRPAPTYCCIKVKNAAFKARASSTRSTIVSASTPLAWVRVGHGPLAVEGAAAEPVAAGQRGDGERPLLARQRVHHRDGVADVDRVGGRAGVGHEEELVDDDQVRVLEDGLPPCWAGC